MLCKNVLKYRVHILADICSRVKVPEYKSTYIKYRYVNK